MGEHVSHQKQQWRQAQIAYEEHLATLSSGSVHKHFSPFEDIAWDHPDYEVRPDDDRWILGEEDNLGAHPWYQALPKAEQIRVGQYRFAQICKVGLQFEQMLIGGIMYHNLDKANGNPEFRYSMHEATEETHHIQMFQEFVNRTGVDAEGAPGWFKTAVPLLTPIIARKAPAAFWSAVLAGEEPIDHAQKDILRHHDNLHPLMRDVMSIHVAEEARHIGFAHEYLKQHVPRLSRTQKLVLAAAIPAIMRIGANVIMRPSKKALADMGIPRHVANEIWWDSPDGQQWLRQLFPDARMLADEIGLRDGERPNRIGKLAWKLFKIDGSAARYRNQPQR